VSIIALVFTIFPGFSYAEKELSLQQEVALLNEYVYESDNTIIFDAAKAGEDGVPAYLVNRTEHDFKRAEQYESNNVTILANCSGQKKSVARWYGWDAYIFASEGCFFPLSQA
jgi:hypothetical protein